MAKRSKDIPFGEDPASRLLPWIVAVMVYIASLAISGAFVLSAFADRWETGLSGSLTVQIPPPVDDALDPAAQERKVQSALGVIRAVPWVSRATPLASEEMRRLLEPWLGSNVDPRDLPLPSLIAVDLPDGSTMADVDLGDLRRRLKAVVPEALVDDHSQWQTRLVAFLGALRLVAGVLVVIVGLASVTMVMFATRSGLLAHRSSIELLHLFGAHDGYIAGQFQREAVKAGLKGGVVGVLAAGVTVVSLGHGAASAGTVLPGIAVLRPLDWLTLATLPVLTAGIAMLAARVTVLRALGRMV